MTQFLPLLFRCFTQYDRNGSFIRQSRYLAMSTTQQQQQQQQEKNQLYKLVLGLLNDDDRERALAELSKKRDAYQDLAPILWHSIGTISTLLQEIVGIYPQLAPPMLTMQDSNRVCNALALLQCVASHNETRTPFLNAHIPLYLYPFLNTVNKETPFQYLRLTSLGVIGALVKVDDSEVVSFLLQTEIIPLCLRIMESGSDLSKTVATFIVQKILLDNLGLTYICATAERFYAVSTVLGSMVVAEASAKKPSGRLLKHIVQCYWRISDNATAREALQNCIPAPFNDARLMGQIVDNPTARLLEQLMKKIRSHAAATDRSSVTRGAQ
eukprot:g1060.t1